MENQNYRKPHPYLSQFCIDTPKNNRDNILLQSYSRSSPRPALFEQYAKLKQKIQSVQVKNEQIIERIKNFKKSNACFQKSVRTQQFQYHPVTEQQDSQHEQIIHSGRYHIGPPSPNISRLPTMPNSNQNYSQPERSLHHFPIVMQHEKISSKPSLRQKKSKGKSKSKAKQQLHSTGKKKKKSEFYTQQNEMKRDEFEILFNLQKIKVTEMSKEIKKLENINMQLRNIQNKYRSYVMNTKYIIQNSLINFFEGVVIGNLNQIDRTFKKNQLRLMNLSIQIREAKEDYKSKKILLLHKIKRQSQRSKPLTPTARNYISRTEFSKSAAKIYDPTGKKARQFQEVAKKYQDIIKAKNQQILSYESKYKQKQQEVLKLEAKLQQLSKDIQESDHKNKQKAQASKYYQAELKRFTQNESKFLSRIKQLEIENKKIKNITVKLDNLQQEINQKDNIINSLKQVNTAYQSKILALQKNTQKSIMQSNVNMQKIASDLQNKAKALYNAEQAYALLQKKLMEMQCELYVATNKLKKNEQIIQLQNTKIEELENILQQNEDMHDKSLLIQSLNNFSNKPNPIKPQEISNIIKEFEKIQEQLQNKKNQNLILNKQKTNALAKITDLEEKIIALKKTNQMLEDQNQLLQKEIQEQKNCKGESLQIIEERKKVEQDLFQAFEKCNNLSKTVQNLRNENLQINSKLMKSHSQLQFIKDSLTEKENLIEKIKSQNDSLRGQKLILEKKLSQLEYEIQIERNGRQQKIKGLQEQLKQLTQKIYEIKLDQGKDLISQQSMNINIKNNYTNLALQNELLIEKLKEKDKIIQSQKMIETKIIQEYRVNVEKVKTDIREKINSIEKLNKQLLKANKKISALEVKKNKGQAATDKQKELQEQIQDLQKQLQQSKDLYEKASEMYSEIIQQLRVKDVEKIQLLRQIQFKNLRIHELQEKANLKISQNISVGSGKSRIPKQSVILSPRPTHEFGETLHNFMHQGSILNHEGQDCQPSVIDQSFLQNSHLNVSELFKDFPQDRLKLRKKQHKLFTKAAAYIDSLKQTIEHKNKKIRTLQNKIKSLKSSQLVRKQYDISGKDLFMIDRDIQGQFKDYESENLQNEKGRSHRKMKAMQNDTKLIIQENNMFVQQIELLQDEIQRAEEQENSLIKIKDLLKDQIKNLLKKLDDQAQAFDEQLQKQRKKVENSQSLHNYQQLRQIFIKLCGTCNKPGKTKSQKLRQLAQFANHICTILNLSQNERNTILNLFSKTD